jgi:hypothetical protein
VCGGYEALGGDGTFMGLGVGGGIVDGGGLMNVILHMAVKRCLARGLNTQSFLFVAPLRFAVIVGSKVL